MQKTVVVIVLAASLASAAPASAGRRASPSGGSSTTGLSSGALTAAAPRIVVSASLAPVKRGSRASGQVAVVSQGGQRALTFRARHLPATHGFVYALWLANTTTDAAPLGLLPPVRSDGAVSAVEPLCLTRTSSAGTPCLPANYRRYKLIILTRERSGHPTRPGTIVLGGRLAAPTAGR